MGFEAGLINLTGIEHGLDTQRQKLRPELLDRPRYLISGASTTRAGFSTGYQSLPNNRQGFHGVTS